MTELARESYRALKSRDIAPFLAILFGAVGWVLAQVEDDYYWRHHHGGHLGIRVLLGWAGFLLIGAVYFIGRWSRG